MSIGKFTKTTVEDWKGLDCCRIDFRGYDVRCPFFGNPDLWNEEGPSLDPQPIIDYISARSSLEGIILGGEPLRDPSLFKFLKELRKTKVPIRLETSGTRPEGVDDFAGAMMVDNICIVLTAVPGSERFSEACPGADESKIQKTLDLLPDLDVPSEIQIVAVPGFTNVDDIKRLARGMGKKTDLVIRQFDPRFSPDRAYSKIVPYTKGDSIKLNSAAKTYTHKVSVRGF